MQPGAFVDQVDQSLRLIKGRFFLKGDVGHLLFSLSPGI